MMEMLKWGVAGTEAMRRSWGEGQSCAVVPFERHDFSGGLRGRPMACRAVVGTHRRGLARGRRL